MRLAPICIVAALVSGPDSNVSCQMQVGLFICLGPAVAMILCPTLVARRCFNGRREAAQPNKKGRANGNAFAVN